MGKFEKETGRDKYLVAEKEEFEKLIDSKTGKIYENIKEEVNCPLCNKKDSHELFKKQGFRFVKCNNCNLIYVNPQINEEKILDSYIQIKSADLWVNVLLSKSEMDCNTKKFNEELDILEGSNPNKGKILDIGCSIGLFLKLAKDRGWQTIGIELNKKAAEYAKENFGLNIIEKKLEEANFVEKEFDVITLYGVLEHLKNPKEILKVSNGLLRKGGCLAILVPNVEGFDVKIMGEKASLFTGRNHLQYFSIKTITKILQSTGFEVIKYKTSVSALNAILNYIHGNDPYKSGTDVNITEKARENIEKFILNNNLGHYLHVWAKKIGS